MWRRADTCLVVPFLDQFAHIVFNPAGEQICVDSDINKKGVQFSLDLIVCRLEEAHRPHIRIDQISSSRF